MLKSKHLTLFKPKNWKKGGNFDQGFKKNQALLNFFATQCHVLDWF